MTAPSAPASPANAPNCTAHFVGVNVSSSRPTAVVPISRHTGPVAMPGTPPRRSSTASMPNRHSSSTSTAKRRVSEHVDAVLDGQEVVAQEVLVPGDGRADGVLDAGRLGDGRQRLVAEHDDEDQRERGGQRRQRGEQPVVAVCGG